MTDYAKKENAGRWLRHPVLGDPSFDAFEKACTLRRSRPPFEFGVNASLFKDPKSGCLYVYAGLYPAGYEIKADAPSHFVIYRSSGGGGKWECLGKAFEDGFVFDEYPEAADHCPDAVMCFDEDSGKYWLAYDWCLNTCAWNTIHQPADITADSGAALAWSLSPEGPFQRLPLPAFSNFAQRGRFGRFTRGYASTLIKRREDWLLLLLCDSGDRFSWGLACMTAPSPEGPWSSPRVILSVDRDGYFPAPVEFYPCFEHCGEVWAPATSVAKNRNYQAVWAAEKEAAHLPEAWSLRFDGNYWHSRNLPEECCGLWGQTPNGFVQDVLFTVVYPSLDGKRRGTLSIASRAWDEPLRDGFVLTGHDGPSVVPLLCAYRDFTLDCALEISGTVELILKYGGILGPDSNRSDAMPNVLAFAGCTALTLEENGRFRLVERDGKGAETTIADGEAGEPIAALRAVLRGSILTFDINGKRAGGAELADTRALPLAVAAHAFSGLRCSSFQAAGEKAEYALRYNAFDALLGAGQRLADWEKDGSLDFAGGEGFIGGYGLFGKWNVIGSRFDLHAPRAPDLGTMQILVDGEAVGKTDLRAAKAVPSAVVFSAEFASFGRHAVVVKSLGGRIALDMLTVYGP